MLRAVLVDDDVLSLEALEFILNKTREIGIVGKYTDPLEALETIKRLRPELVFLDIEMPELDGFSAAREIGALGIDTRIIFASVYEQYALKAFEIAAVDYLVKPFSESRVQLTVDRLLKKAQDKQSAPSSPAAGTHHPLPRPAINKIPVWKENNILLLDPKSIRYFTITDKKVIVYTKDEAYESNSSLSELEERLNHKGFFRCHKSFLINTDYIARIIPWFNATYMIRLTEGNEQIPVSRHYTRKLRDLLNL
jgi:DNA-binding LytR/AlgR family response regulator